jgi:phosphatidate cytidylyltransferase
MTLAAVTGAAVEWACLAGFQRPMQWLFVAGTALLGVNLLFSPLCGFERGWPAGTVVAVCGAATLFWLAVVPPWLALRWKPPRLVLAIAGWLVLVGAWVALVELQARSPWLVLAAMAIVWIADIAAYFTGRAFGRRKLAPEVSPGKTWEGVYGALAAGAVYAVALTAMARPAGYGGEFTAVALLAWIGLALCLVVRGSWAISSNRVEAPRRSEGQRAAPAGPRRILDRVDALLAAMPAAALLALAFLR